MKLGKPLVPQRKTTKNELVMCTSCKGFYSKSCFRRHKIYCSTSESAVHGAQILNFSENKNYSFHQEILSKFRNDDIGNLCRNDELLIQIGKVLWNKHKYKKEKILNGKELLGIQ